MITTASPFRLVRACLRAGGLLAAGVAPWVSAQTAAPALPAAPFTVGDAPVELPVFEVTDRRVLPPPESWRYASIPGFEVLSSVSARETTRFVKDFFLKTLLEFVNHLADYLPFILAAARF